MAYSLFSLRRWQRSAVGFGLVLTAVGLIGAGCYQPKIGDGGFKCSGAKNTCPSGFKCDLASLTCRKGAVPVKDAGGGDGDASQVMDAPKETSADLPSDVGGADADAGACLTPKNICVPPDAGASGGICDPTCQTECGCREKCTLNGIGDIACTAQRNGGPKPVGQGCDFNSQSSTMQIDNCIPGSLCLDAECGPRCYRFCRSDSDCPKSQCSRNVGSGQKVCDVDFVTCNPVSGATSGCGAAALGCYLSATRKDVTLCDCQFLGGSSGGGKNEACVNSRDCLPGGLICVDLTGTGTGGHCLQVCRVGGPMGTERPCPGGTCTSYLGSTTWGYCN